jgi:D-glycero-D-manno-heptose 1,7-bisphosphate phosphatase
VTQRRRGVFLDLSGTLVQPLKPDRLEEQTLIPGVVEAIARLSAARFVCPVITVQSRIAKGLWTAAAFEAWFAAFAASLRDQGAEIVGPYVCPHRFREPCLCKKPNAMLYERASAEHFIDVASSFVVGDSPDDVRAAVVIGARSCLVRTGWAADPTVEASVASEATFIVPSIAEAVDRILASPQERDP